MRILIANHDGSYGPGLHALAVRPAAVLVLALCCLLVSGGTARWLDGALALRAGPRMEPPAAAGQDPSAGGPLSLRLVDLGGVAIPPDTAAWGDDYSHHSKAFRRLILDRPPHVDEREFERIRAEWAAYVRRMADYGNNGVVVPLFLELLTLDSVPEVYRGTDYPARHRLLRDRLRQLFAIARGAGMEVYLATDLAPLTPPLSRHLGGPTGLDWENPELWRIYRAAFGEALERMPEVRGVVIRAGEAGILYSRAGWPYRSRYLIDSAAGLRAMLRELLPVFESRGRLLILRSWTVGVGELGDLHTDPATYQRVLGDIDSPSLVVSTKLQAGDFFRPLPLNPTLLAGRHRRIVELQARREFEGSAAFPNFLGWLHADALRRIREANPLVIGSWTWTQTGGPLRAGPMSLYPLHGAWLWIDANVYLTSRLAADPAADVDSLTLGWVRRELTDDAVGAAALAELLDRSPNPIEQGYYIGPFAARKVTVGGVELPPLLWIMEWDVVGGWSSVWSVIYRVVRPELSTAIAEGFQAVAEVDRMRQALDRARPALADRPERLRQLGRSLEYESTLLLSLAWYRAAFLSYYRWLDTGDRAAYRDWRAALPRFRRAVATHQSSFAGDLDFPPYDFSAALRNAHLARRATELRWLARGAALLLGLTLLGGALSSRFGLGRALWRTAVAPWRLAGANVQPGRLLSSVVVVLVALTAALSTALSFTAGWAGASVPLVLATFTVGLRTVSSGLRRAPDRDAALAAGLGPLVWLALILFAAMSLRGPLHLWYLFWSGGTPRLGLVAMLVGLPLWTLVAAGLTGHRLTGGAAGRAVGAVLLALGAALLLLGILAPGLERGLAILDRPLGILPMTYAIVVGVTTYTRLPEVVAWTAPVVVGLLLAGSLLAFRPGTRRS